MLVLRDTTLQRSCTQAEAEMLGGKKGSFQYIFRIAQARGPVENSSTFGFFFHCGLIIKIDFSYNSYTDTKIR